MFSLVTSLPIMNLKTSLQFDATETGTETEAFTNLKVNTDCPNNHLSSLFFYSSIYIALLKFRRHFNLR